MKLAGRIAAAIEVITEIRERNRPASEALRDWGKAHRFAGSGDRHVIGTIVYDTLRHRNSSAARAGADTPRALVLGTLKVIHSLSTGEIAALCTEQFGPGALTAAEQKALDAPLEDMPPHVAGDYPEWLTPELTKIFGSNIVPQMHALAERAPIDLRTNTLKAKRDDVLSAFAKFGAQPTKLSPIGIRISPPGIDAKSINVEAEPAHGLGQFEVQDEASQLAAVLTGANPGETVLDLCAGAGGKSLALAAMMHSRGLIIAYDRDKHRLRPIFERINRSGATNIDVIPADEPQKLTRKDGYDLVVVDAPCTGSGTWRRKPDAKWRLSEKQLNIRLKEQVDVLEQAHELVRPGGRLAYFTCSVLPVENDAQVDAFLKRHQQFEIIPYAEQLKTVTGAPSIVSANGRTTTLQLTPHDHNTDGFFVCIMRRKA